MYICMNICIYVYMYASRKHHNFQTKQERGLKGTRKSYKAERSGNGGGAKPSKHEEEGRKQM